MKEKKSNENSVSIRVVAVRSFGRSLNIFALVCAFSFGLSGCSQAEFEKTPVDDEKVHTLPGDDTSITPSPTPPPESEQDIPDVKDPDLMPTATPAPPPPTATPAPPPPTATPAPPLPTATPAPPPPTATPIVRSQSFTQDDKAGKIDILVIDDNSFSMDQIQRKLASRFDGLMSRLIDLDYQIGITTTDLDSPRFALDGRLLKWDGTNSIVLSPQINNSDLVFKNTVTRKETIGCNLTKNECPSGNEQPMRAMIRAFEQQFTANAGFFRDGVDLAVIVLSNEDELSNGAQTTGLNGKKLTAAMPNEVLNAFDAAFHKNKKLAVHGIVIKPGDQKCLQAQRSQSNFENNSFYATQVSELVTATGGSTFSVCDGDYTASLKAISDQVRKLVSTFDLSATPKAGTLKVTLTPAANISWSVSGSKLIFDTPPPAGTRIDVTYQP